MNTITKHNSQSMKTVVETYIIEETQELIYDNEKLNAWNDHVANLGLVGQTKIQAKDKSPIPFLHMKRSLISVFEQLCPSRVDVSEYDKTPIPVEILDLVALSVRENYFSKIEIWYDDKSPDPACIGLIGKYYIYNRNYNRIGTYDTRQEMEAAKPTLADYYGDNYEVVGRYLIGRWADVKATLEELTAKAKKLFFARRVDQIDKEIKKHQREKEDLHNDANNLFGFDDVAASIPELPF
jgi:hypothetical protein